MGLCPILLNMLQFWLIDSIVKASDSLGFTSAFTPPGDESREPLFMNEPDSEGEDGSVVGQQRRQRGGSGDVEEGYTSPTKSGRATTHPHSRALSPSSLYGKLNKEIAATELDESGKRRTSIEFQHQQPPSVLLRRGSPTAAGESSAVAAAWGGIEDAPEWEQEQQDVDSPWGGAGTGKQQRSPKLGGGRRSLSGGRGGRKSSGGSGGSWRLDTISPSRDQTGT